MRVSFIDPGALRSEFALEQCVTTPDDFGAQSESWVEVATLFAHVEPIAAQSIFGAGQTIETATHRVTTRWRTGLASGMRLRRNLRVLDIITVHDPDETRRYLVCGVKEVGA
ncbi:phage head closure protein [Aminobacter sp. HY435]|uniref:phage head closure protein n=1 Tax=Aminobacter sp. HY435 TaxID=2970917 RepID=UPI0022B96470|nr:phage head closure protein [Aminobacter sp. HY435]